MRSYYWLAVRASVIVRFPYLLIRRILCAVLERYFCNRIPLQTTRWPFCYSVSDRYRAFISANPRWKCSSFYIVLISPNWHHRRYFLCQNVTKPLWHNRNIVNIGNTAVLLSGPWNSPDEIIKRGRFSLCEGNRPSPMNSLHREPATQVYFFVLV